MTTPLRPRAEVGYGRLPAVAATGPLHLIEVRRAVVEGDNSNVTVHGAFAACGDRDLSVHEFHRTPPTRGAVSVCGGCLERVAAEVQATGVRRAVA